MLEDSFSRRCSWIDATRLQLRLWRQWTNCLPSTRKLAAGELVLLGVTLCVRKEPGLCWMIFVAVGAAQSIALPSSALSKACQYALTLWRKLTRFLEYPELELSNNLAENSMRPVALGRKNWIHIGSPQAGPKVAAILSVVESCRRLKLRARLLGCGSPRVCRSPDPAPPRPYSRCVVRPSSVRTPQPGY